MKYSTINHPTISLSKICLGTMTFGTPVAFDDAVHLIDYAVGSGINFIDTANMYEGYARVPGSTGGVAEEIVGAAIQSRRDKVVVATKLGMKVGSAPEDEFTSPAAIEKHLNISLSRLKTDYIDIYYLHKPDPFTPAEEILLALDKAVRAGKIRCYGVSNYSCEQLKNLVFAADQSGLPRPAFCQPSLSLLNDGALGDILPFCTENGIAVVPYQVLQGGLLTGKYKKGIPAPVGSRKAEKPDWVDDIDEATYEKLQTIEKAAAKFKLTMTQYAIRWATERPGVVSAIVGVKNTRQIDDAAAAIG